MEKRESAILNATATIVGAILSKADIQLAGNTIKVISISPDDGSFTSNNIDKSLTELISIVKKSVEISFKNEDYDF